MIDTDHTDCVSFDDIAIALQAARELTDDPHAAAVLAVGAVLADELRRIREMLFEVGATPERRVAREMQRFR